MKRKVSNTESRPLTVLPAAFLLAASCNGGAGGKDADGAGDPGLEPREEEPDALEEPAEEAFEDGGAEDLAEEDEAAVEPAVWYVDDLDDGLTGAGTQEDPFRSLQHAVDTASDGDSIIVMSGRHYAEPRDAVDPTCGNCGDADYRADIPITVGFHIRGKALHIRGESVSSTELHTGAGYGVFFEDAGESSIENLVITGGVRDADGRATDAGIVVRYTDLTVRGAFIVENDDLYSGEPDPVVGVMGIAGREGARLIVSGCRIHDNSWDGIALYRSDPDVSGSGASALIVSNSIGCNTGCINPRGRGVGIGITWDAEAEILNNRIFSYWKGIGSFGTSRVVVKNNIVVNQHGWGVIASGGSRMDAVNNVIANNGTTGFAAWESSASGSCVNNIITGNGRNTDEWVGKRTGVWMNAPTELFRLAYNDIWNNEVEEVCYGGLPGDVPCTPMEFEGIDGNLSVDPALADLVSFELDPSSPLIDAGDPDILDADGTRSDIGAHGGPDAGREEP